MKNWTLARASADPLEPCILCGSGIPAGDPVLEVVIEVKVLFKKLVTKQAHLRCACDVADLIKKLAR